MTAIAFDFTTGDSFLNGKDLFGASAWLSDKAVEASPSPFKTHGNKTGQQPEFNLFSFLGKLIEKLDVQAEGVALRDNDQIAQFRLPYFGRTSIPVRSESFDQQSTGSSISYDPVDYLSQEALYVIGSNGYTRLKQFAAIKPGWDFGEGKNLDYDSFGTFNTFVQKTKIAPSKASIFMSVDGHLILNWIGENDDVIEIEFGKNSVSYFDEVTNTEVTLPLREAGSLVDTLNIRTTASIVPISIPSDYTNTALAIPNDFVGSALTIPAYLATPTFTSRHLALLA